MDYRNLAYQTAQKYGLDPDMFVRQIQAESAFNPAAVSSAGAVGLGQLMPATAKELGVDPTDPAQNLEGAARYMKQQLDRFGDPALALAAYNAGPSRVAKANGIPNITETQNYVAKILGGKGGASMDNKPAQMFQEQQPQQSQGLLGGLLGGQGIGGALGLSDDFRDRLKMGLLLGSDPRAFAPMVSGIQQAAKERRAEAKLQAPKKTTVEYLKKQGFNEIADLVDAGSITAAAGATLAYQEGQAIKGLERSMQLEAFKAGIKPEKPLTQLAKIQADYAAGRLNPEQYETAVQVYANKNKMGLRVGADGAIQFTQGGDFKFTEQQSKDNVYATRAAGALEAFEPVAPALTSFTMRAAEFDPTGVARGTVQSDDFQLAQQSGNEFLQAVLRKDTGAAITPNEMVLYGKTYLPQPGDNEKVLVQKSLARKRAVAAIQSGMSPLQILTSEKALAAGRPSEQAATASTGDLSVLSDAELDALIGDLTGGVRK